MNKEHSKEHWQELISTIVSRIGADAFLRLCAAVLKEDYPDLAQAMIDSAEDEEWPSSGADKDEWKHEAEKAMRLKR